MTEWDEKKSSSLWGIFQQELHPVIDALHHRGVWVLESPEKDWQALDVHESLERIYHRDSLSLARPCPAYCPEAALWGFGWIYECCRLLTFRDLGTDEFGERLPPYSGDPTDPAAIYSVDLSLRFLPGIATQAEVRAENDPLLVWIRKIAEQWPLSCVGMNAEWREDQLSPILANNALRLLLLDRLHACTDETLEGFSSVLAALCRHTAFDSFSSYRKSSIPA